MGTLALVLVAVVATAYTLPPLSISHTNGSELSRLLSLKGISDICVSSALDSCAATPHESQSTPMVPPADWAPLFGRLHDLGISDVCVASALDVCADVTQKGQLETLLKEARDLQQETRDLQQETRDLQLETRDLQQEGRDSQQETRDLQQEGRDLQQETRDRQQETRDLQQEAIDLLQEDRNLHQETSDLLQETKGLLQDVSHTVDKLLNPPRHCKDLLDEGDRQSGVRVINPYPRQPELEVYCDQTTDGGGWTVFQRRTNSTVREDFYRTWHAYKEGFGNLEEEFWLGLDALHVLTSTEPQELRIDLANWEGGHRYAKYSSFSVDDHEAKYRLTVEGYSGTAGDSFTSHSGQKFTTHDSDNDSGNKGNCAVTYRGAWWYRKCHNSNLNGYQYESNPSEKGKGITWSGWMGSEYSLRRTTMMLRPAQQN